MENNDIRSPSLVIPLPTPQATQGLGKRLGKGLPTGSIILLQGELGSGKTTLVQGIGEGLGIEEPIISPTFTLINEYTKGRLPLYHLDLYRLQPQEISTLYLENYWEGVEVTPGITAIEWSQRLPYQPSHYLAIELFPTRDRGRRATIQFIGEDATELPLFRQLSS